MEPDIQVSNSEHFAGQNNTIPRLKPSVLCHGPIFGFGYRSPWVFGNIAQAMIAGEYSYNAMLAQQSARELHRTKRTFREVIRSAVISAYEAGLTMPWGADGDHLKNEPEIRSAVEAGCTHFTYDVSESLKTGFNEAIKKIISLYNLTGELKKEEFTTEVSLDETISATNLNDIEAILSELKRNKVHIDEIAPRFPGYFEKGIDYYFKKVNGNKIVDTEELSEYLEELTKLSSRFGFRVSIHSGSDKFTIYPLIAKLTRNNFHIKTAGTYYLEELRVVALKEPDFFRQLYGFSLKHFGKDRKTYELSADINKIPDLTKLSGEEIFNLLESAKGSDDLRQMLHVTYGSVLTAQDENEKYIFRDRIYSIFKNNLRDYYMTMKSHLKRHLTCLLSV